MKYSVKGINQPIIISQLVFFLFIGLWILGIIGIKFITTNYYVQTLMIFMIIPWMFVHQFIVDKNLKFNHMDITGEGIIFSHSDMNFVTKHIKEVSIPLHYISQLFAGYHPIRCRGGPPHIFFFVLNNEKLIEIPENFYDKIDDIASQFHHYIEKTFNENVPLALKPAHNKFHIMVSKPVNIQNVSKKIWFEWQKKYSPFIVTIIGIFFLLHSFYRVLILNDHPVFELFLAIYFIGGSLSIFAKNKTYLEKKYYDYLKYGKKKE